MASRRSCAALPVLLLALGLAAACAGTDEAGETDTATVERVADGDTLVLTGGSRVRLVQIDAPELGEGECYAEASARELAALAGPGTRVTLQADLRLDDVDVHGRLLRYVYEGDVNVNVELVLRGAAAPYLFGGDRGLHAEALLAATEQARAEHRGMWGACRVTWTRDRPVTTRSR